MPRTIILNGVSSAGKTTIARTIQEIAPEPWLLVSMDSFIGMLPDQRELDADWFPIERIEVEGVMLPHIVFGQKGTRLLRSMRGLVADLAQRGFCTIVDDVCRLKEIEDYQKRIPKDQLRIVAVTAPLEEIERRELVRGDRMKGLARAQSTHLHSGIEYDLEVDTAGTAAYQCAESILDLFTKKRG